MDQEKCIRPDSDESNWVQRSQPDELKTAALWKGERRIVEVRLLLLALLELLLVRAEIFCDEVIRQISALKEVDRPTTLTKLKEAGLLDFL